MVGIVLSHAMQHVGDASFTLRHVAGQLFVAQTGDHLTQTRVTFGERSTSCRPGHLCNLTGNGPVFSLFRLDFATSQASVRDIGPRSDVQDELPDIVGRRDRALNRVF